MYLTPTRARAHTPNSRKIAGSSIFCYKRNHEARHALIPKKFPEFKRSSIHRNPSHKQKSRAIPEFDSGIQARSSPNKRNPTATGTVSARSAPGSKCQNIYHKIRHHSATLVYMCVCVCVCVYVCVCSNVAIRTHLAVEFASAPPPHADTPRYCDTIQSPLPVGRPCRISESVGTGH